LAKSVRLRTPCWNLSILPPILGSSPLLFVIFYFSRCVSSLHCSVLEFSPGSQTSSLVLKDTTRMGDRKRGTRVTAFWGKTTVLPHSKAGCRQIADFHRNPRLESCKTRLPGVFTGPCVRNGYRLTHNI
jgi:hypothetical protein